MIKKDSKIEFVDGEVDNMHADHLFSTHCFEEFLSRRRAEVLEYDRRHGKVEAGRYWIEPVYLTLEPVLAIRNISERFSWFEVRLPATGPDFLWQMSPTPLVDRIPADSHPTTWDAPLGANPLMPLGKIRNNEISIFGRTEEEVNRSILVANHVVNLLTARVICWMDQIALARDSDRFAGAGVEPHIW